MEKLFTWKLLAFNVHIVTIFNDEQFCEN